MPTEIPKIVFKVFFCVVEAELLAISKTSGPGLSCATKCNAQIVKSNDIKNGINFKK
jgi:hypothetical protein